MQPHPLLAMAARKKGPVLNGPFHWMNQLELSRTWVRRADCMRELSDALYEENEADRKAVDEVLKARGSTFEEKRAENHE